MDPPALAPEGEAAPGEDDPPPLDDNGFLDNAFRLLPQPLAAAAARAANAQPLNVAVDDLNEFDVDLSWAREDLDSFFLTDTEYLQLGGDQTQQPLSTPPTQNASSPPVNAPPLPDFSPQAALPNSNRHSPPANADTSVRSEPKPPTSSSPQPPSEPLRRTDSSSHPQKRPRTTPKQQLRSDPIHIAPRARQHPSAPSTSVQSQSAPLLSRSPFSMETLNRSPSGSNIVQYPMMSPHSMVPLMSMYPLQHHRTVLQRSAVSPPNLSQSESAKQPKKKRRSDTPSTTSSPPNQATPRQSLPQFPSPPVQLLPQGGVVGYDPNIVPFFQMAHHMYASAAAAGLQSFPPGVIPPLPPRAPVQPYNVFPPPIPSTSEGAKASSPQSPQTSQPVKKGSRPVIISEDGTEIVFTQQAAARLEPHPVLGRLQLQTPKTPSVEATTAGMSSQKAPSSTKEEEKKVIVASSQPARKPSAPADSRHRPSKKRLVWTPELHERFVRAIDMIGLNNAVPKTLVTIMNVEGLTTEHVKSHLQKYRNSLRKEAQEEAKEKKGGAGGHIQGSGAPGSSRDLLQKDVVRISQPNPTQTTVILTGNQKSLQQFPILPNRISVAGLQRDARSPKSSEKGSRTGVAAASVPVKQISSGVGGPRLVIAKQSPKTTRTSTHPQVATTTSANSMVKSKDIPVAAGIQYQPIPSETVTSKQLPVVKQSMKVPIALSTTLPQSVPQTQELKAETGVVTGTAESSIAGLHGRNTIPSRTCEDSERRQNGSIEPSKKGETISSSNPAKVSTGVPKDVVEESKEKEDDQKSQPERDLELELMKERTLQMQLQLQMVLHRTIALERKLEEKHSERVNAEAAGAEVSGRPVQELGNSGEATKEGVGKEAVKGSETYKDKVKNEAGHAMKVEADSGKGEKSGQGAGDESEVKALLNMQIGLRRELEATRMLLNQRIRTTQSQEGVINGNEDNQEKVGMSLQVDDGQKK